MENNQNKKGILAIKIVACVLGALVVGVVGFCVGRFSIDEEIRSLMWTKNQIQSHYYEEISDDEFYKAVFDGVNGLLDPYSAYLSKEEYADMKQEATGEWSGLGLTFSVQDAAGNPQLLVTSVSGNSPAEKAGLTAGVKLVGFGDKEDSLTASEDYDALGKFLDAKKAGEEFFLEIEKPNGETFLQKIAKESFFESYVLYRSKTTAARFIGEENENLLPLSALDEKTAYIRLSRFNGNAGSEFVAAMNRFKEEGKTNLILDLRGDGGGYMDILCEVAACLCKDAGSKKFVVATAKYRSGKVENFYANGSSYHTYFKSDSKITVLADNGTASASECLIGAMRDYGTIEASDIYFSMRGGEAKSFGKGIMQETRPRNFGSNTDAVKLTTAYICWPKTGTCIHGVGVLPVDETHILAENYEGDAELLEAIEKIG